MRQGPEVIRNTLDQLDEDGGSGRIVLSKRNAMRFRYRVSPIEIDVTGSSGGEWQRYSVAARNLSRTGMAFLIGQFLYPNSFCRVHLRSLHGCAYVISGKLLRTRYLKGSGNLYEVAVRFDKVIDVALFARGAIEIKLLVIDDDPAMQKIIHRLLSSLNATLVAAQSVEQAAAQMQAAEFDLVLLDTALTAPDGDNPVKALRDLGFARPIIGLATDDNPEAQQRWLESGYTTWLSKPFKRDAIEECVLAVKHEPVLSNMLREPGMAELIDEFVDHLPEQIRDYELAFLAQDWKRLLMAAADLKGRAGMHGFESISTAATELDEALANPADRQVIRARLNQLTRLCFSARRASPSSVG